MVIIRDINGNIIGKQASEPYVATRKLRARHEQALCDKAMGITREPAPAREPAMRQSSLPARTLRMNMRRVANGMEPVYDDVGLRSGAEDAPCDGV